LLSGTEFEVNVLPADEEFPHIFASSCAKRPSDEERRQIERYKVNICLSAPGGSIDAAVQVMRGAAAVLTAGGAGVFVDNSGIAHGAGDWHTLLEGAETGGVYWAFISTVRSESELYTLGMHVLGFRDAILPATDDEQLDARTLHSFLGYAAFSGAAIRDGDVVRDVTLPTLRVSTQLDDRTPKDAPMFNPYGRWRLAPLDPELN
jgi:hypothetical protein